MNPADVNAGLNSGMGASDVLAWGIFWVADFGWWFKGGGSLTS